MTREIRCPCGATALAISGEPLACVYCHCDDCQVAHGAAYLPAALYRSSDVQIVAGEVLSWRRTTTIRATCRGCGTRLYAEPAGLAVRSVVAYLLPPGVFRPAFHMQCQHALIPIRDELPHYRGYPAMLGGSDEVLIW